ncbi:MAG: hypothetical protein H6837_09070 [Planctomycetes bacterium]|nr:hypothetical protein [Planctomycetota bacterium]
MRDHEVFRRPHKLDVKTTEQRLAPSSWTHYGVGKSIDGVAIGTDREAGWCTLGDSLDLPDTEILCGGRNSKGPHYAAVWRQGNLLHFGFQSRPDQMTAFGKELLVNCIHYIARFRENSPLVESSNSYDPAWIRPRFIADRLVRQTWTAKSIPTLFDAGVLQHFDPDRADAFRAWYRANRGFLMPSARDTKKLALDADLKAFGMGCDDPGILAALVKALETGGEGEARARRLLQRLVHRPLAKGSAPAAWRSWLDRVGKALFFSDHGGFRWYVDPLALRRGVASADLRGPARASLPSDAARAEIGPVRAELRRTTADESGAFDLEVRVTLREGWHIYALNVPAGSDRTATALQVEKPATWQWQGEWRAPAAKASEEHAGVGEYSGTVVFRRRLARPVGSPAGPVKVTLSYGACDAKMCRPPESLVLRIAR